MNNNTGHVSCVENDIVKIIIEIERHSNIKWEYDRINNRLFLDRVLKYPYFYPYAYGFFPNTLGNDGDELDVLLITDKMYPNYNESKTRVEGIIVGGLMMIDEKGEDEKIFVVPIDEIESYNNKTELELQSIQNDIVWFFSNYKTLEDNKWSRVEHILNKEDAVNVYKKSVVFFQQKINTLISSLKSGEKNGEDTICSNTTITSVRI